MCIRQTPTPLPATASIAPGAVRAATSFTIVAPAAMARRMTPGLRVSIETGIASVAARRSTTGRTRRSSSSSPTGALPGRVDSPPTSMIAAPSAAMRSAHATAESTATKRPPSEKESGVTFRTPMTTGLPRSSEKRPHWRCMRRGPAEGGSGWRARRRGSGLAGRRADHGFGLDRAAAARSAGIFPVLRRFRHATGHHVVDLGGIERFVLEQRLGHRMQDGHVVAQDSFGPLVALVDQPAHFLVDDALRVVGNVLGSRNRVTEEDLFLVLAVRQRTELVREAPARDHAARKLGRVIDVALRAGRHGFLAEDDLLGHTPAKHGGQAAFELAPAGAVAVAFREVEGDAQSAPTRHDRDLVDRVVIRRQAADDGVARLVIGRELLLFVAHDQRAALGAHHDLVLGALELLHRDEALARARREQ